MNAVTPHVVLVHGAWHGGWSWGSTPEDLRARGLTVSVIDQLPSTDGGAPAGLKDDAKALREHIAAEKGPVVVVAHSYGGMVASELAGEPSIAAVVYLAAFLPVEGETLAELMGGQLPPWVLFDETRTFTHLDPSVSREFVAVDAASPEQVDEHVSRMVPHAVRAFLEPSSTAGWGSTPVTYVVAERDQVIPPEAQHAMAGRAGAATTVADATHLGIQSQSAEAVEIIAAVAAAVRPR